MLGRGWAPRPKPLHVPISRTGHWGTPAMPGADSSSPQGTQPGWHRGERGQVLVPWAQPLTAGCSRWGPQGVAHNRERRAPGASPPSAPTAAPRQQRGPGASTKGSAVGGAAQRGLHFQMNIDSANYRPPCRQLISSSQKDGIELRARGIHRAQQDAPQTAQRPRQPNNLQQN